MKKPAQTLLLVEDTRSDALLYATLLERATDTPRRIDLAPTLAAASHMLAGGHYDAVLLDLGLPDSRDLQGVERIVARHPDLPVIVLTGQDEPGIGERAIAAGAQDYLHKGEVKAGTLERALRYACARQRLENAARETAQELQALFDRNPLPVFVYDEETFALLAANDAALAFYGHERSALLRLTALDLQAEEQRADFAAMPGSPQGEGFDARDWRHVAADGSIATVRVHVERLTFQGCRCRIAIVHDVTAQRRAQQRLQHSERRYREIFEQSLGCICVHDLAGTLLALNPAAADALDRRADDMIGRPLSDFLPEASRKVFHDYLARIRAHGEDRGVFTPLHRNGQVRSWMYHNRLYRHEGEAPVVLGYAQDITDQQLVEKQLRAKSVELAAVNDSAPMGLFRADAAGRCTYVNRTYEQISGIPQAQALGDGWARALHPDDRDRAVSEWSRFVGGREEHFADSHRFLHADGRTVWCKMHAAPMTVDGELTGFVGTVQDVTRERDAQAARRRGDRRLATLADALPLLLMFLDRKGRVEFVNRGWSQELERPQEQMIGKPIVDLIQQPATPYFVEGLARAMAGKEYSIEFEDPHGAILRTWHAIFIPQHDPRGHVDGIHVMLRDVTLDRTRQRELADRAERDALTGLFNRSGFEAHGHYHWQVAGDLHHAVGVFFIDLDGFKAINDELGHAAGDDLLRDVSTALAETLRADDIIGRMGGDEFAVIALHVTDDDGARNVANKIIEAIGAAAARHPSSTREPVSCSVGYHVADTAAVSLGEALKRADEALYVAKRGGKHRATGWPGGRYLA
ncbi:PAS domain S-box protein [Luteimonas sp. R10]|uniref:PAS domain S-box protein n=1 Tax=Luteimonas sp. R10 TaxID=3108176 RepID=UPI00308CBE42|nr:PAS domain S-box protein [Luteimonas sp. R10]